MTSALLSDFAPSAEQTSSPSSVTPTRQGQSNPMSDFTSPSAYLNQDAYSQADTPHGSSSLHDVRYEALGSGTGGLPSIDESFSFAYGDYDSENGFMSMETMDHLTPSAALAEDDRTPVISETQNIASRSLPIPPHMHGDDTIRASSHSQRPLMSPFHTFDHQSNMLPYPAAPMSQHPQYIDPSAAFYPQPHAQHPYTYPDGSSQDQNGFAQIAPQYVNLQPHPQMGGQMYAPQGQYYAPAPTDFDDTAVLRSRHGSPTSSAASSSVSVTRSGSTSSDPRPARPKVKLTYEDKKNIVELHRANSSLRQEDIARMYGVDRSTISKILIAEHRWTQPQEVQVPAPPKICKAAGGRFPTIDARMDEWFEEQISLGNDVRDSVAREKAKSIAKEIGFPAERFKASAKWLDKFKDRRRAAGKPVSSSMHMSYGYYPYTNAPYPTVGPRDGPTMLSRSQSAVTLSSSSSGQELYRPSPSYDTIGTPNLMNPTKSEPDLVHLDMTPSSRQRSQSSPQMIVQPGMQSPSSGKALRQVRPSPLNLHRQNSYHGSSTLPRRPATLTRANSTQGGGMRRARPTSLAASAFGITPITVAEGTFSPMGSPSSTGTHSRQRSDVSLAPFTSSLSGMSISPDMSDSGDSNSVAMAMSVPPLTPITPGHQAASNGVFPANDYGEIQGDLARHYATLPNKHYANYTHHHGYPPQDFAPGYAVMPTDARPDGSWHC